MSAASTRPLVAFATAAEWPNLVADDLLAVRELEGLGIDVAPAVWSDPGVDWARFDAVVIRSCWDYHVQGEAFARWLGARGVRSLWNPARVAAWNMHKRYLLDLAAAGVPTIETVLVERGTSLHIGELMQARGWPACVVKPAVSLTSFRTHLIEGEPGPELLAAARELALERDTLIQPFRPEVRAGELSLVFFEGEFSHCVRKTPAAGDFRSQEEFGGTPVRVEPDPAHLRQARAALAACEETLLYARVDGVATDEGLLLMELEAIDPSLYLAHDAEAPARFARAIAKRLAGPV